jgi:hypothetical protein
VVNTASGINDDDTTSTQASSVGLATNFGGGEASAVNIYGTAGGTGSGAGTGNAAGGGNVFPIGTFSGAGSATGIFSNDGSGYFGGPAMSSVFP